MTSARKIKLKLETRKPRNPLVAPSLQRKAGSHRGGPRREREATRRELKQVLKDAGH
jgi:hypothetical protein